MYASTKLYTRLPYGFYCVLTKLFLRKKNFKRRFKNIVYLIQRK